MEWTAPQHEEIDLNCEISSYALTPSCSPNPQLSSAPAFGKRSLQWPLPEAGAFVFGGSKSAIILKVRVLTSAGSSCASRFWVQRLAAVSHNGTAPATTASALEPLNFALPPARKPKSPSRTTETSGSLSAPPRISARRSSPRPNSVRMNKALQTLRSAACSCPPRTLMR